VYGLRASVFGLNQLGAMGCLSREADRYEDQSRSDGAIDAKCIHTTKATFDGRRCKFKILNPYISFIKVSPTVAGSPRERVFPTDADLCHSAGKSGLLSLDDNET